MLKILDLGDQVGAIVANGVLESHGSLNGGENTIDAAGQGGEIGSSEAAAVFEDCEVIFDLIEKIASPRGDGVKTGWGLA